MLEGELQLNQGTVHEAIFELQEKWQDKVVQRREVGADKIGRFPFADKWDLSDDNGHARRLNDVMPQLAKEGNKLFQLLFYTGDEGLRSIGEAVKLALRSHEQIICMHADHLIAPWWMLYLPATDDVELDDEGGQWSWEGFWGFSHLIEHTFTRTPGWDPCLRIQGQSLVAGVNVDRNLDEEFIDSPCVRPVIEMFQSATQAIVRETKSGLARDIKSPFFTDQILYFGCHGTGITHATGPGQSYLKLTDQDPIRATDFIAWLNQTPLRSNPLVFINACQGGQMSSLFYTAFGRELLTRGANCLLGPHVDIPPLFAREYAREFFDKMLHKDVRAGDIVREIVRDSAVKRKNPLSLVVALYRGLDTHVCAGPGEER
ncbi:hypothetical protein [Streptomyces sp. NBC_00658]|uniref:hypothetical protein n=1 Tax=Streptomyces sp. NBC_00658 TaxID=2975800 RepID=UPI00324CB3FA